MTAVIILTFHQIQIGLIPVICISFTKQHHKDLERREERYFRREQAGLQPTVSPFGDPCG